MESAEKGAPRGEKDVPHLFEPFFRGDSARAANQNGMGLGLSIVSRTAEAFGGRVIYAKNSPAGSRFTVLLRRQ
jgi:signal transduction histidine kinase